MGAALPSFSRSLMNAAWRPWRWFRAPVRHGIEPETQQSWHPGRARLNNEEFGPRMQVIPAHRDATVTGGIPPLSEVVQSAVAAIQQMRHLIVRRRYCTPEHYPKVPEKWRPSISASIASVPCVSANGPALGASCAAAAQVVAAVRAAAVAKTVESSPVLDRKGHKADHSAKCNEQANDTVFEVQSTGGKRLI